MFVSASIVTAAKRNGSKQLAASALPGEPFTQVDAVVDLLAGSTSPAAQRDARELLRKMADKAWKVIRGAHASRDATLHVLIEVDRRYHLRLDGNHCVFDITIVREEQTQRPSRREPWVRPGA